MKMRIMVYLMPALLLVFSGNPLAAENPVDAVAEPSEISTSEESIGLIQPQGLEGPSNTFYGVNAGVNTTEVNNSFFGADAGYTNTTGSFNSFFGTFAGYANSTGGSNSFFGRSAGQNNSTGGLNSFFGMGAGFWNSAGEQNSFFGMQAGYTNTTGASNSFFGELAGFSNTTGASNSFFGTQAGNNNTTGSLNSFFGMNAGFWNTAGEQNSFFGDSAGLNNTGSGNVFIGFNAGYNETGSNKLYIANSNTATPLIWGDFTTKSIIIHGNFRAIATAVVSDKRWKKNIQPLDSSLDKISSLQGVTYEWRTDEYPDYGFTENKQIGLIAQDVEAVLPELVSEDHDGYKAVSYAKLTAVLVEAVKELKAQNERQQAEIERLQELIKDSKI